MTALRQRAQRNARSLQTEIRETLQASVPMPREQWFAEAAAMRAHSKRGGESALDAIRRGHEERDAAIDRALRGDYDDLSRP